NRNRFKIQEPGTGLFDGSDPRERRNFLYTAADGTLLYFQHYSGQLRSGSIVTALRLRGDAPELRIDAKALTWNDTAGWTVYDGTRRVFVGDSVAAEAFDSWQLPGFIDPPKELLDERVYPDEMSLRELQRRIDVLRRNGEPSHALRTHWHF